MTWRKRERGANGTNVCERCGYQSDVYQTFPSCRECGEVTCPGCDVPRERSEDERHVTLCRVCAFDVRTVTISA